MCLLQSGFARRRCIRSAANKFKQKATKKAKMVGELGFFLNAGIGCVGQVGFFAVPQRGDVTKEDREGFQILSPALE
jgi:hypothetical protein